MKIKKILIVRLDEIGDLILTTPFLRELRKQLPKAFISLVIKPELFNLMETCPYVDKVHTDIFYIPGQFAAHKRALLRAFKDNWLWFWNHRFDLAIMPRWDADPCYTHQVIRFSKAKRRIGYSEKVIQHKMIANKGGDFCLTDPLDIREDKHEVERNLDILRYLGYNPSSSRLELWTTIEDEMFAEDSVFKDGKIVALCPGAGHTKRMWPADNFIALGKRLIRDGYRVIIVGGKKDQTTNEHIEKGINSTFARNFTGKTTLRETFALLKRAKLYIGNDTGCMHMAAAAGIPVIELSCHPQEGNPGHYNSPLRFGPWAEKKTILQPKAITPCSGACEAIESHCIENINVDTVIEAALKLITPWQFNLRP